MTDKTTSEVLNLAADLIEERGWTAGSGGWPMPWRPDGSLCIEGGIIAALDLDYASVDLDEFWTCPAYKAVCSHLGISGEMEDNEQGTRKLRPAEPLWRYNDGRGRTATEVIEVLRATAVIEAARESQPAEVTR